MPSTSMPAQQSEMDITCRKSPAQILTADFHFLDAADYNAGNRPPLIFTPLRQVRPEKRYYIVNLPTISGFKRRIQLQG